MINGLFWLVDIISLIRYRWFEFTGRFGGVLHCGGSHRGHYCGLLFWNQKVPSIKKKKENANAKSGELINASINHMHCVTILLTFTVNQLLFTMALFCDLLEISGSRGLFYATKPNADPCCYYNHITRLVNGKKYSRWQGSRKPCENLLIYSTPCFDIF